MSLAASMARGPQLLLALLNVCALAGCSSCRQAGFIAELIAKQSTVERDFGRAPDVWSPANAGERFELGDGVRTGAQAQATFALPRRARLLIKSDTVVRFKRGLDAAAPAEQIELQRGELTIDTGALDLGVSTSRGVVKLTPDTTIKMHAQKEKTHIDVVVGRVEYVRDGATHRIEAGAGIDFEVLKATFESTPVPLAAAPLGAAPQESAKATAEKPAADGGGTALAKLSFQDAPAGAIITLPAGESAIIHDPAPPSDVRITFSDCPELGVLELDRGNGRFDALRVKGSGEVRASIPRGSFRYRLRCARAGRLPASAVRAGRLTVRADAATRPLPLTPVTITADADGRRYNVSYQNRLPMITLRWPDAPRANAYRLFVRPDAGAQLSLESNRSSITLESGRVGEGLHQFWFETRDKKRSEQGLLQVSFDYTARTAYLTSPVDGDATQHGRARFAGGTLIGSSVQVQGAPAKLDAQGRFAANVVMPAGAAGVCVRVQHPSAGIHYYIRHLH